MSLTRVRATDFVKATRGGSRAALVRCSDGNYYVIKSPNNAQDRDVLGSEYVYTRFGEMIGAQVQPQAAVEVGEDIIEAVIAAADVKNEGTDDVRMLTSIYQPSSDIGPYYGSLVPVNPIKDGVYDFVPPTFREKLQHPERIGAILALDAWLAQMDSRQIIYWSKGKKVFWSAIDHGYTSFISWAEWEWKCNNDFISVHKVFEGHEDAVFRSIEAAAVKIAAIRLSTIDSIFESCPPEWRPDFEDIVYTETFGGLVRRQNNIMINLSARTQYSSNSYDACVKEKYLPVAKQGKILTRTRAPRARKANPAIPAIPDPGTYEGPINPILPGARLVSWADPDQ